MMEEMKITLLNFNLNYEKLKEQVTKSEFVDVTISMHFLLLYDYMEKERDGYMGDYAYERSDDRHDYRNGYYDRPYFLSIGKIDLKVPRTRSVEFSTVVFDKYERCDQALILSLQVMVVNRVSTRKLTKTTEP